MNELLAWYGYEGVDRLDLLSKTSSLKAIIDSGSNSKEGTECNGINGQDDSTTSNRDTSRESSRSPCSINKHDKHDIFCGWCRREVSRNSPEFLTTRDGPRYCSESCFIQSRRAFFKRAKTCDWCRHVKNTVSYVGFQDGASQLQFCSDKCLNQYKMQIFCNETQAHLDMNPHLKDKERETSGNLITPELWLKNCRSRSISPISEFSKSRSPSPPISHTSISIQKVIRKPRISVAPVSKLSSKNLHDFSIRHTHKRRTTRISKSQKKINVNIVASKNSKVVSNLLQEKKDFKAKTPENTLKTDLDSFAANINAQSSYSNVPLISDNETRVPNVSSCTELSHSVYPKCQSTCQTKLSSSPITSQPSLCKLPFSSSYSNNEPTPLSYLACLGAPVPPITLTIPYPVIIPLPIPIPIPLPVIDFLKLNKNKQKDEGISENILESDLNEPLDFTKAYLKTKGLKNDNSSELSCGEASNSRSENECNSITNHNLKLNIKKLYVKRLIAKESEKSRPLRKRKQIVDYLRHSNDDDSKQHKG